MDEQPREMLKCSASHLANVLHLTLASLVTSKSLASKFALLPSLYIQVYHFVLKKDNTEKHSRKILDSMNLRNSKAAIFYQ